MAYNKINISSGSTYYQSMLSTWNQVRDVLNGSKLILANIDTYLHKFQAESDTEYERRKKIARFENFFTPTIKQISDLPFSKQIEIPEPLVKDEFVVNFVQNVNGKGSNINSFFRSVFYNALAYGFSGVLVDSPVMGSDLMISQVNDMYPSFILFNPINIKGIWGKFQNGRFVIERVWLSKEYNVYDANSESENFVEKHYDYFLSEGKVKVDEYEMDSRSLPVLVNESTIELDHIPFYLFYASDEREDDKIVSVTPAFYDLLINNLAHFNKLSSNDSIITMASFPMIYATGLKTETEIDNISSGIGPKKVLYSGNADSTFGYVEHSGKSIECGRANLVDLETKMRSYEVQFLMKKFTSVTATEVSAEESRSSSYIESLAIEMDEIMNLCMRDAFIFRGQSWNDDWKFKTFKKFSIYSMIDKKVKNLIELYKLGSLSRETLLNECKKFEIIDRDLDIKKELEKIEQESISELKTFNDNEPDDPNNENNPEPRPGSNQEPEPNE